MLLVPVTVTEPVAADDPSRGFVRATVGTAGVGVGVATMTMRLVVVLAWEVSRFLAVISN
jgi:hypothetical protein